MHHKKRVEETRVCISLYRLLTVEPRDLISSSRYHWSIFRSLARYTLKWVHLWVRSETEEWDPIFPLKPLMGLNL